MSFLAAELGVWVDVTRKFILSAMLVAKTGFWSMTNYDGTDGFSQVPCAIVNLRPDINNTMQASAALLPQTIMLHRSTARFMCLLNLSCSLYRLCCDGHSVMKS